MPECAAALLAGRAPKSKPPAPAEAANVMKSLRVYRMLPHLLAIDSSLPFVTHLWCPTRPQGRFEASALCPSIFARHVSTKACRVHHSIAVFITITCYQPLRSSEAKPLARREKGLKSRYRAISLQMKPLFT